MKPLMTTPQKRETQKHQKFGWVPAATVVGVVGVFFGLPTFLF